MDPLWENLMSKITGYEFLWSDMCHCFKYLCAISSVGRIRSSKVIHSETQVWALKSCWRSVLTIRLLHRKVQNFMETVNSLLLRYHCFFIIIKIVWYCHEIILSALDTSWNISIMISPAKTPHLLPICINCLLNVA